MLENACVVIRTVQPQFLSSHASQTFRTRPRLFGYAKMFASQGWSSFWSLLKYISYIIGVCVHHVVRDHSLTSEAWGGKKRTSAMEGRLVGCILHWCALRPHYRIQQRYGLFGICWDNTRFSVRPCVCVVKLALEA